MPVDVVVVGAGPTGLTLALLLASYGVRVHVLEAQPACSDEPRAIALADESLRTAHTLGVLAGFAEDVVWTSGSQYLGAKGQLLARTQPAAARLGFPVKTLFDQPGYVTAVLQRLGEHPSATLALCSPVESVRETADGVAVTVGGGTDIHAAYLVGCDGGRSTVRQQVGISMAGSSQTSPWIVLDTVEDPRDNGDTEFHCDPARPHVLVPGTQGRCRYEFMLLPGETPEQALAFDHVRQLLKPYREITPEQVRRTAVYVSHQLVATRFRAGRVFLAGDAAHQMPPFAGQGLNTGIRDATNLAWKLAAVLHRQAGDALLETYESERRPHAQAMVELSRRLGGLIMTGDPLRARLRDTTLQLLKAVPPLRRHVTELRFVPRPVFTAGCLVAGPDPAHQRQGAPLPQGQVRDERAEVSLLDDVLGPGWALVAVTATQQAAFADLPEVVPGARRVAVLPRGRIPRAQPGCRVVTEQQPVLHALPGAGTRYLLVRPDRYVAADFLHDEAAQVAAGLARYLTPAATPIGALA